jgi:type II secretory pathway component PulJ
MLSRMLSVSPYRTLDEIAQLSRFFDSRAALGAQMEDELAVVAARKEVLTEPRQKEKRGSAGQKKGGDEKRPAMDKRCE